MELTDGFQADSAALSRASEGLEGASGRDLEAALRYVLTVDAPRYGLQTASEVAAQVAFRLAMGPDRRAIALIRRALASIPAPPVRASFEEALQAAHGAGLTVVATHAVPRFLRTDAHRRLLRRCHVAVDAIGERTPLGTPAAYRRASELAKVHPRELVSVGDDPCAHVRAARRAGCQAILIWPADDPRPPRAGQLVTAPSLAEALQAFQSRHRGG